MRAAPRAFEREKAAAAAATSPAAAAAAAAAQPAPAAAAPAQPTAQPVPASGKPSLVTRISRRFNNVQMARWDAVQADIPEAEKEAAAEVLRTADREHKLPLYADCIRYVMHAFPEEKRERLIRDRALLRYLEVYSNCAPQGDATKIRMHEVAGRVVKQERMAMAAPAAMDSRGGIVSAPLGADGNGGSPQALKDFTKSVCKGPRAANPAPVNPAAPAAGRPTTAATPATTGKRPRPVEATPATQRTAPAPAATTGRRTTARGQSVADVNAAAAAARAAPAAGLPSAAKRPRSLFQ